MENLWNQMRDQFLKANGLKEKDLEEENKFGKMDLFMKEHGKMIWLKDMEGLYTKKEMYTKVNEFRIKLMDKEHMFIKIKLNMKEVGYETVKMVMELKHGRMVHNISVNILKEKNKAQDNLYELRDLGLKANF